MYALVLLLGLTASGAMAATTIPFVGCPGMEGTDDVLERPVSGKPVSVDVDNDIAMQLAYYAETPGDGVIAPVGWHCYWGSSSYSGEDEIVVAPTERDLAPYINFSPSGGVSSPVVYVESWSADSGTGMFAVNAIAERFLPRFFNPSTYNTVGGDNVAEDYQIPTYSDDDYSSISTRIVSSKITITVNSLHFLTPPNRDGFGTWHNSLVKSDLPIEGFVFYLSDSYAPAAVSFGVRLPKSMAKLKTAIVEDFPVFFNRDLAQAP